LSYEGSNSNPFPVWRNTVAGTTVKVRKITRSGGLNCVFGNFFYYVLDNCPQVQSLKKFRV